MTVLGLTAIVLVALWLIASAIRFIARTAMGALRGLWLVVRAVAGIAAWGFAWAARQRRPAPEAAGNVIRLSQYRRR